MNNDGDLDLDQDMNHLSETLNEFKIYLKYFIDLDLNDFCDDKDDLFKDENASLINDFIMKWNELKTSSMLILKDIISMAQNEKIYINHIANIKISYDTLKCPDKTKMRECYAIKSCLDDISSLLYKTAIKFYVSSDIESGINFAYQHYKIIGQFLSTNPRVLEIYDEIKRFATDSLPKRYAAIVGPSFMGKTQLAFAFSAKFKLIYVNLLSILKVQSVYTAFSGISELFRDVIADDAKKCGRSLLSTPARELLGCKERLSILGLLKIIINLSSLEGQDWLDEFIKLREVQVVRLTRAEFCETISADKLKTFVLFIDEFPVDYELILYMRNIARAIGLPVVLAATNAKIGNMVGTNVAFASREESAKPWVKLITKLPRANPVFLAKFIEFKCDDRITTLENYLSNNSNNIVSFNIESLMSDLRISCSPNELIRIKIIFKILFDQAKTCLPGIIFLILQNLDRILKESASERTICATNSSDLPSIMWKNISELIYFEIHLRKSSMSEIKSYFASGYIISAHEEISLKPNLNENFRAATIDSHFFYLGSRTTPAIEDLSQIKNTLKISNTQNDWKCHSYFSRFDEDIFIHLAAWGPSTYENSKLYGICYKDNYSLAYVIEKCSTTDFFSNTNALKNNFKAQETLVMWAIGNASHSNVYGKTSGIEFLREFAGHLQSIKEVDYLFPRDFLDISDIPPKLIDFLKLLVVPYCVENSLDDMDQIFVSSVSNFMNIGHFTRCFDNNNTDIKFPIYFDGIAYDAFVECKYRNKETDIDFISEYTKKSVKNKLPLTIFVTNHVSEKLLIPDYFLGLPQNTCADLGIPRLKSKSIPSFKLNYYLISHSETIKNQLTVNTLYEHQSANGCVLIITTNLRLPKV